MSDTVQLVKIACSHIQVEGIKANIWLYGRHLVHRYIDIYSIFEISGDIIE